jgi:hypothetical protein
LKVKNLVFFSSFFDRKYNTYGVLFSILNHCYTWVIVAYVHELFYARLANKQYSIEELMDNEVAITVNAYAEDIEIANKQQRIFHHNLEAELKSSYSNLNFKAMIKNSHTLLGELFGGAANSIGSWPNSSAYYSVDIIFDTSDAELLSDNEKADKSINESIVVPSSKLIEVNFMGDWHSVEIAVDKKEQYEQWANDLVTVLATNVDVSKNLRLNKLML